MKRFTWSAIPETAADFEALMSAADSALASQGVEVVGRPLHIAHTLYGAFGWGGNIFPPRELAERPGFSGEVLIAKALKWYEEAYGDQLKTDMALGSAPVVLGNAVWELRAKRYWGPVRYFVDRDLGNRGVTVGGRGVDSSFNVLCAVEKLPQGLADRLSDAALAHMFQFYISTLHSLEWANQLPDTPLLSMAVTDYLESTAAVIGGRYGQARWAAEQAVEKTMKGVLDVGDKRFPTGGAKGHDLEHLRGLLQEELGIVVPPGAVVAANCSADVRYGKVTSSQAEALAANHSVLEVFHHFSKSPQTAQVLRAQRPARLRA
ncbi:MAG: hypothetical protein U1F48_10750 [Burkholderiales bacterium]